MICQKNNLKYITFQNLEKTNMVKHCITTRLGGVSEGVYAELNMSFTRGEQREKVLQNYDIVCNAMGFDKNSFVLCHQTHTTNILAVTEQHRGMGVTKNSTIKNTDGLITNITGIQLTAFSADCTPILLLDVNKKAIGAVHAGWRGSVNSIVKKAIEKMTEYYGTNPSDIMAGIGPSIGQCCFQVDAPVVEEFRQKLYFANDVIQNDTIKGKYKIDLWETNKRILMDCGVKEQNIELSKICTMCHTDLFYSHRVMGNDRGNMAAIIALK